MRGLASRRAPTACSNSRGPDSQARRVRAQEPEPRRARASPRELVQVQQREVPPLEEAQPLEVPPLEEAQRMAERRSPMDAQERHRPSSVLRPRSHRRPDQHVAHQALQLDLRPPRRVRRFHPRRAGFPARRHPNRSRSREARPSTRNSKSRRHELVLGEDAVPQVDPKTPSRAPWALRLCDVEHQVAAEDSTDRPAPTLRL